MFYISSRKIIKVCSRSVLEQTKVNSRTVIEQTITTFLELFLNHFKNNLEKIRDIFKTLNETFLRDVLQLFIKVLKICSGTVLEQI